MNFSAAFAASWIVLKRPFSQPSSLNFLKKPLSSKASCWDRILCIEGIAK